MQEQLNIDAQVETVNVMTESVLQRYEIVMETPTDKSETTNPKNQKYAKRKNSN